MTVNELIEQQTDLRGRLDEALEKGAPTADLRADLESLTARISEAEKAEQEAREKAVLSDSERVQAAAAAMVRAIKEEAETAILSVFEAILPTVQVELSTEAAETLVKVREGLAEGETLEAHLADKVFVLTERIDKLTAERNDIVQRRKSGRARPDDGQRLALLDADLEGLRDLLARAEHSLRGAKEAVSLGNRALQEAEPAWIEAAHDARVAAFRAAIQPVEEAMAKLIHGIKKPEPRDSIRTLRADWKPGETLRAVLASSGYDYAPPKRFW